MTTGLDAGLPAGRLYCECLANALAVDLLNRYAVRRYTPVAYQGGLPGYRLKRLLDHIGDNLAEDLSLPVLASLAGMSQLGERHARSAYDLCTDVVYHCGPRGPLTWTPERTYTTMSECQRVLEETQKKDYLSPPEQKCVRYRPD